MAQAHSRPLAEWAKFEERVLTSMDHLHAVVGARYDREMRAVRRVLDSAGEKVRVREL